MTEDKPEFDVNESDAVEEGDGGPQMRMEALQKGGDGDDESTVTEVLEQKAAPALLKSFGSYRFSR